MGEGGFGKGGGFGDKGKGKGKGKGKKGKGKGKGEEKEWVPVTKLGRLVKDGKIQTIEDIYLHSLPIKEYQIVDSFFVGGTLKDEVMKIHPVQKMSSAGQTNRFVCYCWSVTRTVTSVSAINVQKKSPLLSGVVSYQRS